MIGSALGKPVDPMAQPKAEDLKDPILWLCQAQAMSEAAITLMKAQPSHEMMPLELRGIGDSQFCATSMMLLGYSLEISLKAMRILRDGIDLFIKNEKQFHHHRLSELANFIPNLGEKDRATLDVLTNFTTWAGRYPDPGVVHLTKHESVFSLSEKYRITLKDVLDLAAKVMKNTEKVVAKAT